MIDVNLTVYEDYLISALRSGSPSPLSIGPRLCGPHGSESLIDRMGQAWGGTSRHHDYAGGLLVHTAEVLRAWRLIRGAPLSAAETTAAVWHDAGKILEYDSEGLPQPYRREIGHLVGSVLMFHEACRRSDIDSNSDFAQQVTKLMLSHHGKHAWKSATVPSSGECLGLHAADVMSTMHGRIHADTKPEYLFEEEAFTVEMQFGLSGEVTSG